MKCPNCGHDVRGRFCTNCGTQVAQDDPINGNADSRPPLGSQNDITEAVPGHPAGSSGSAGTVEAPSSEISAEPAWAPGYDSAAVAAMEPMTLGQIVSSSFAILQLRLRQFLGVTVAYAIAMFIGFGAFVLILGAAGVSGVTGNLGASILGVIVAGLVLLIVFIVAAAVSACAYINIARGAEPMHGNDLVGSTMDTLHRAWRACPNLLLALLALAGVWVALSLALFLVGYVLAAVASALAIIAYLGWIVAVIWLGVNFAFVTQTAVIDSASATDALRHSMDLVQGYWWRTAGYLIVAALISVGIVIVGSILTAILGHIPVIGAVLNVLLEAVTSSVIYAFYITYTTLMFFDLKARKEGVGQETASIPGTL